MTPIADRIVLGAAATAIVAYLIFPVIVVLAISFSAGNFLEFPPPGLSLRWYRAIAGDPEWVSAFMVTLKVGSLTALLATLLGVPAAFALVRYVVPAKALLSALILCALVTPPIVTAISTYLFFVPLGLEQLDRRAGLRACGQRHALRRHQHGGESAQRRSQSGARRDHSWRSSVVGDRADHPADHFAGHHHRRDPGFRAFGA